MHIFDNLEEFLAAEGTHLGFSEWLAVPQATIDAFADATGDHQWIHVDESRAASGPFGTTIAHGYLTLSLIPALTASIFRVGNIVMGVNYGLDKVRFPSALPSGTRIRAGAEFLHAVVRENGTLASIRVSVLAEGDERPVCVADTVTLFA